MKLFLKISLSSLFCIFFSNGFAQLPFIQHPVPPGLNILTLRMNDLQVDATNNKWVAFGNAGVGMYDGTTWSMFDSTNGSLPTDSVICLDFDTNGDIWIGSKKGIIVKSGNTYLSYNTVNSGLTSNVITAILRDGTITWVGTKTGLFSFNGTTWAGYNTGNSGLTNDSITTLLKGNGSNIFIGTRNGLSMFDGTAWTNFTPQNTILNPYISDLEIDNFGKIWITSGNLTIQQIVVSDLAVFILENNFIKRFDTDYYFYDLPFTYIFTTGLNKDANGNIAFHASYGNSGRGLIILKPDGLKYYKFGSINSGSFGSLSLFDNNGEFWILPRFRFYFYSADLNDYVQLPLGDLNFENHRTLDINEVRAGLNVGGDMHWDYSNPEYEVPKGSNKHSIFASALWIGGYDAGDNLHLAGQTYRQTGTDYWPGPVDGISIPFDSSSCIAFDKIWKMDKWKVEEFKNQFLAGNVINGSYTVPSEIATWPAKGNGLVTGNLAPFYDTNGDGLYDVMDGDYPQIKGDQMLYYIFNDSLDVHTETSGLKMGVEIRASAYSFYCQNIVDTNQAINWTTFYNYEIINKSIVDYDSVFIGLWSDADLGAAIDDYVGCDTALSAGFVMNGDNNDETVQGYGDNPPMQNIKILRGTLADPGDGIDNNLNGIIDEAGERTSMNHFQHYDNVNNSPTGNPNNSYDFYNYMRSVWLNGQHVTYGGDGFSIPGTETNFMFSGIPYSGIGWTELITGNPVGDRRFVLSSGPFTMLAGETATLDFAYIFTWDSLNANGLNTSVARNRADLQRVQYWFDTNTFPTCQNYTVGNTEQPGSSDLISLYPNPVKSKLYLNSEKNITNGTVYTIYDVTGKIIQSAKLYSNTVDVSDLSSELFFIKLTSPNGDYQLLKFLKQ